ncbi:gamma-carotene 1'-hydroxylase CruF [Aerosakkonema funiforme]|uniref:gamma-carotene 1'-hydroxylase CruF n=1 Tax=Aerosakkonema funiforme TaxID=1246630 RepID=UPI0035B73D6D
MKQLVLAERFCLIGHIVSMAFGLAGLLLVLPNPELIVSLPAYGQTFFQWSMAGGGVVYIVLGAAAVAIYAYRTLGLWRWLAFMVPSVFISLGSELLGTSTGFPFGHYGYLSGLGYKVAGLVPVTIPLSWFYLGFVSYLLARTGLNSDRKSSWLYQAGAIALGALLLTSWDFVLDPAMSQTMVPFWHWEQPGAFFGMPYQNFAGWFGTGAVFMTVASILWKKISNSTSDAVGQLTRSQLNLPLTVYLGNVAFATIMSLAAGIWIPVVLGLVVGVFPAVTLWWAAKPAPDSAALNLAVNTAAANLSASEASRKAEVSVASAGVAPK